MTRDTVQLDTGTGQLDSLVFQVKKAVSTTLARLLADTRLETEAARRRHGLEQLKHMVKEAPPLISFRDALAGQPGLIAELKQKSPSQGRMRLDRFHEAPPAYGSSPVVKAISVLTNATHFGPDMTVETLRKIKVSTGKPVLRKDFITDEYQVYQARAFGADAILLMANVLAAEDLKRLSGLAAELGMDALFEIHSVAELEEIPDTARIIGVNCRRFDAGPFALGNFRVARIFRRWFKSGRDLSVDFRRFSCCSRLPAHVIRVAESGVTPANCAQVLETGFHSILVGTSLLTSSKPVAESLSDFEQAINRFLAARPKDEATIGGTVLNLRERPQPDAPPAARSP